MYIVDSQAVTSSTVVVVIPVVVVVAETLALYIIGCSKHFFIFAAFFSLFIFAGKLKNQIRTLDPTEKRAAPPPVFFQYLHYCIIIISELFND
jgi:hypothetical protein